MNKENKSEREETVQEHRRSVIFCILVIVYLAVCAVIYISVTLQEQNAYVDVTPILSEKNSIPESEKINLNTATLEELMTLNGIGEVTAQRIIEYRDENNGFVIIDELTNIKGIGDKTFENLRPYITV